MPLRFLATRKVTIDAAHQLKGLEDGHPCGRVHGHTYEFGITVSSTSLDDTGMVVDFGLLAAVVRTLDHRLLNDIIPQPTAENIAKYVWDEIELRILRQVNATTQPQDAVRIESIVVKETANCSVTLQRG